MKTLFYLVRNLVNSKTFDYIAVTYNKIVKYIPLVLICLLILLPSCNNNNLRAVLVNDATQLSSPVFHGIHKLTAQLESKGYDVDIVKSINKETDADLILFIGLAGKNSEAANQLVSLDKNLPEGDEGLVIQKGKMGEIPMLIICGADTNGLMYALLRVARCIGLQDGNDEVLALVQNIREKADLAERSISTYTMQRAWFEEKLYNEEYLKRYFDQLSQSRINSYTIIFGYENGGFLAPPYPYFFNTEEFPGVRMANINPEQQRKNIEAFNRMIELAHKRGIKVTVGIWDHIYRGGVQDGGLAEEKDGAEARVSGLDSQNILEYNLKAFEKFLVVFPEIDRIQFRMHPESGLTKEEMPAFWHNMFGLIAESKPGMPVDIRAKQLPDEIINDGISQGLNIRVTTKYWMEQMGLPFHPTHVNRQNMMSRRHGYADLLRYPQRYVVHWRLWNGGTARILLWGDPEYIRRIAQSAHLYNGNSIEFNEPLATKMETQPHDKEPFELLGNEYRYYDYEFERYWYFFDVFGHMTYNANPPEDIWTAEFKKRFGPVAGTSLRKGLHLASQVLPRIVASSYNYNYFPTTRGWAEKIHFGDLENFSKGGGTDIQQFVSFDEEAINIIEGREDPRLSVFENSKWFASMANSILQAVERAEKERGKIMNDKEFLSTKTDLNILANLARYYSCRVKAAVYYKIFKKTDNLIALNEAIDNEELAIQGWKSIVDAAGEVYTRDLMMGTCRMNMCGNWETELQQLNEEFQKLKELRENFLKDSINEKFVVKHIPVRHLEPGRNLPVSAYINSGDIKYVRCAVKTGRGDYRYIEMYPDGENIYSTKAEIPANTSVIYYYIEAVNSNGKRSLFSQNGIQNPVAVRVTDDITGPEASIDRIKCAPVGEPLKITARVKDLSGVKWVSLRYRHLTQFEDFKTVEMKMDPQTGFYSGQIPASFITPGWDIMYFIETMDEAGNGRQFPDFEIEAPYVIVKLKRKYENSSN